jgi:hypothetical protein
LGGFVLASVVMFKPNVALVPILLCVSWLLDRRWRTLRVQCSGMAAGAAVTVMSSSLVFGSIECWLEWRRAVASLTLGGDRLLFGQVRGNLALTQSILETTGHDPVIPLTLGLVAGALGALWWSRVGGGGPHARGRSRALHRDVLVTGVGCAIALLAAPLAWVHYFVLAIPLVIFFFRPSPRSDRLVPKQVWIQRGLAALAVAMFAPSQTLLPLGLTDPQLTMHLGHLLFSGACLILLLLALWTLALDRPPDRASAEAGGG